MHGIEFSEFSTLPGSVLLEKLCFLFFVCLVPFCAAVILLCEVDFLSLFSVLFF